MKRVFILTSMFLFISAVYLRAGNRSFLKDPDNSNSLLNQVDNNLYCTNDSFLVTEERKIISDPLDTLHLKDNMKRWDRIYRRSISVNKNDFKGHLPLFEIGVNSFANTNYSGYSVPGFMDLKQFRSLEVNIRILRYSLGLQKTNDNFGLLTGLELNLNNYYFSNPYTLVDQDGHTEPLLLDENGLKKSKLSTTFLSVPLLFEIQFPDKKSKRFFISAGVIGGLKIGSHTKVKHFNDKTKNHDDFNINPFRYGATFRIGYSDINIFATWYKTPLFKSGRGPEMNPFTIGIGLINK